MLKKLICLIWGHKYVVRAHVETETKYIVMKYCVRCGKKNENIKTLFDDSNNGDNEIEKKQCCCD